VPAAAVIPALIAYMKVVAVIQFVVGFEEEGFLFVDCYFKNWNNLINYLFYIVERMEVGSRKIFHFIKTFLSFYFEEIRVFKAGFKFFYAFFLNILAWYNRIGFIAFLVLSILQ